jgi:predicted nucleic acid-binding protein
LQSNSPALRILLDTSFLLPTLGISVSGATQEGIKALSKTEIGIYYSRISILESLWVATRTVDDKTFDDESFRLGLRSIMEGGRYKRVGEDSEIFREAFTLCGRGHKDMIDNILYVTAARLGLFLLTMDDELRKFVHENQLKDTLLSVGDLADLTREPREATTRSSSDVDHVGEWACRRPKRRSRS